MCSFHYLQLIMIVFYMADPLQIEYPEVNLTSLIVYIFSVIFAFPTFVPGARLDPLTARFWPPGCMFDTCGLSRGHLIIYNPAKFYNVLKVPATSSLLKRFYVLSSCPSVILQTLCRSLARVSSCQQSLNDRTTKHDRFLVRSSYAVEKPRHAFFFFFTRLALMPMMIYCIPNKRLIIFLQYFYSIIQPSRSILVFNPLQELNDISVLIYVVISLLKSHLRDNN